MCPSCDPDKEMCDGGEEIYGVSKTKNLRFWYSNYDKERRNIKGKGLSFPDFLLAKYGKSQTSTLVWDNQYVEWCDVSPSSEVSSQESNKPRPRDYTFLYCLGKDNGENIMKSINEGPFHMGMVSDVEREQHEKYPTPIIQVSLNPQITILPTDDFQLDSTNSSTENLIESLSNSLALLTQSYKSHLPQTNNQLRTSSNARNKATVQDGIVVVQDSV
ncbi:hypothetical protein Tco_0798099 [Tanacetum coccineum]